MQTLLQSIYCWKFLSKHTHKYTVEIWNWKQVHIILWKEQRDRGKKEISEERMREVEKSDNDMTYKEMISILSNIGKR